MKTEYLENLPSSVPEPHRQFLGRIQQLGVDGRIVGVAIGGSLLTDSMDEFSDLDLIVIVEPSDYPSVMTERHAIAASLGHLLAAFTGEHVGEPRVLICLYDKPLLHVDLKFVSLEDVCFRVEDPVVLWQRAGRIARALASGQAKFPAPDRRWIEERFWVWVHYACARIARGELFEAIDFLSFLRLNVLGPLGLQRAGGRPVGVRRIEMIAPEFAHNLRRTIASYDAIECLRALRATVDLYRALRSDSGTTQASASERATMEYLLAVEQGYGLTKP